MKVRSILNLSHSFISTLVEDEHDESLNSKPNSFLYKVDNCFMQVTIRIFFLETSSYLENIQIHTIFLNKMYKLIIIQTLI